VAHAVEDHGPEQRPAEGLGASHDQSHQKTEDPEMDGPGHTHCSDGDQYINSQTKENHGLGFEPPGANAENGLAMQPLLCAEG